MVKKLIKYLYLRGLLFEIISYILMLSFIVVVTIEIIYGGTSTSTYGFAWFAVSSGGALYAMQDRYFIHTLPMEQKEVIKAHKIYYRFTHIKLIVFLIGLFLTGSAQAVFKSFGTADAYIGVIVLLLFIIYLMGAYLTTVNTSVNSFLPIDADQKRNLRSKTRLTVTCTAFFVVVIATFLSVMAPVITEEKVLNLNGLMFASVAYFVALIALVVIRINQKDYYKKAINHIEII